MRRRFSVSLPSAVAITVAFLCGSSAFISGSVEPAGTYPNPYRRVENPLTLPAGRSLGCVMGIDIDRNGRDLWVLDTCGGELPACVTSKVDPIMKFDASGRFVKSFGGGLIAHPHGLYLDTSGNIWIVDGFGSDEPNLQRGHQVFKFSPDGKLLLTLGTAGIKGDTDMTFNMPSDVLAAPNGNIFVADGHFDKGNARIVKFNKDGKFIKAWGSAGAAPGQFGEPHSLAMDSKGRLFVGDRRTTHRIQIFDQDGKFLDQWKQFGSPSEIFIDRQDAMYVTDALSDAKSNPGVKRGIYIGSAKDGRVTAFIPESEPNQYQELVTVDKDGVIWTASNVVKAVWKYVKK